MTAISKKAIVNRVRVRDQRHRDDDLTSFVNNLDKNNKIHFSDMTDLISFRLREDSLGKNDRLTVIEQALTLLDSNYVHLPLKQAMHATNPVQRLKLLKYSVLLDTPMSDIQFHREVIQIFMSTRDLHTNYYLPEPFNEMIAFVPFMIEEFIEAGARRYLVTDISGGFTTPSFGVGVEVESWNGVPIERAVELQGNQYAGSNLEARRARGTVTLTVRPLKTTLPPDEDFVIVGFKTADGEMHEFRTKWLVFRPPVSQGNLLPPNPRDADFRFAASLGLDEELEITNHVRKLLFADAAVADDAQVARKKTPSNISADEAAPGNGGISSLSGYVPRSVMDGSAISTPYGEFAYIRIRRFIYSHKSLTHEQIIQSFMDKFLELIEALPQDGLIIDVRGNGGGYVVASERILQLITPKTITPQPAQFINSGVNLEICKRHNFLSEWVGSISESVLTGAQYSRGFPLTTLEEANDTGQRYHGPITLITDALSYSATDIFAAGFQDHEIGPTLGVHKNTGAGGANVWDHGFLVSLFPPTESGSPYLPLPKKTGMRVAIRRTLRVLGSSGNLVEDLGVVPTHFHEMTRNDLLHENTDLKNRAAEILDKLPLRKIALKSIDYKDEQISIVVDLSGVDGCDVLVNERAHGSIGVSDGVTELVVDSAKPCVIELRGYSGKKIVAARRIHLK